MLFQGLQLAHAGYRHPHNVLCLLRGLLLLTRVNPRAVLPDVRHVEEVLVDPAFPESIPEQGLMGPGGAGADNHAIQPLVADGVRYLLGGVSRTYEETLFGMFHVVQRQSVVNRFGYIHHPADIRTAVAHEYTNPRLLFSDVPLVRIHPIPVSYTHLRAHETVLDLVCR